MDQAAFEKLPLLKDFDFVHLQQKCGGLESSLVMPDGKGNFDIKSYSIGELMFIHYAKPLLNRGGNIELQKIYARALSLGDSYLSDVNPKSMEPKKPYLIITLDKFISDRILFKVKSSKKGKNIYYNPSDVILKGVRYDYTRIEPHYENISKEEMWSRINRRKINTGGWNT